MRDSFLSSVEDARYIRACLLGDGRAGGGVLNLRRLDPSDFREYRNRGDTGDATCQAVVGGRRPDGPVFLGSDRTGRNEECRSAIRPEIVWPLDVENPAAGIFEKRPEGMAVDPFVRDERDGDFGHETKDLLRLLMPHIRKAHSIRRRVMGLLERKESLERALDMSPCGVVILDSMSQARFVNRAADVIFSDEDGITLRYGAVRLYRHAQGRLLELAIDNVTRMGEDARHGNGGVVRVDRPSGSRPYVVLVCLLGGRAESALPVDRAGCLLLIHDPSHPGRLDGESLRRCYGLTESEALICQLVFEGMSVGELSDKLEITRNTVKTHMKHIFAKCSVHSQLELVRLLAVGVVN
ncbi:MAG: helix-turn-helix transcriptional regulator [Pseudomonadota bacterium]|nr:helix-turn-helix transcriptional regulator [Pseudomonadota bacterium]